ncbi:cold-shock protein [Faecalibacter bovis]|uniref:Cold shock domain-containing protein n=1 Tax=Faecalibacter bovis TaxID=2898187 RepID=A0ABX7XE74_9FLAO|nr:cold shock domain-containing protein [Faecalibacter bovis]MBS7334047.1 cold shock domain-containing protein [Weeksellaceae bacterium]QTV06077.1 cold shock domain-containing protein [Faecalibacter bovis]
MQEGTVKFFNEEKGFGFITNANGEDVFVHVTGLIDRVSEGDQIVYKLENGKKGLMATNVKLK